MLGEIYRPELEGAATSIHDSFSLAMRAWLVARNRYAEDKLAQAVSRGVQQYVLLGAGLDTFAHRNPHPDLTVFEVDHPATQQWKRDLLMSNGLQEPSNLRYVPVDFERQSLARQLESSGLDFAAPTVFAWLGVVLYLTHPAFRATLDLIAAFPAGSGVIMDYALPRHALALHELEARDMLAARVQSVWRAVSTLLHPGRNCSRANRLPRRRKLGFDRTQCPLLRQSHRSVESRRPLRKHPQCLALNGCTSRLGSGTSDR
jgi:methyltransferase (TIGR00027 family)